MNASRPARDEGFAAVELAIFMSLLLGIAVLMAPLAQALLDQLRVEKVAGLAMRFATQQPGRARPDSSGLRPTATEVQQEAKDAFAAAGGDPTTLTVTVTCAGTPCDPSRQPAGTFVTITATTSADLGPFGGLLNAVGFGNTTSIPLAAHAAGRME